MMKKQVKIAAAGILLVVLIGGYFGAKAYRQAQIKKLTDSYSSIDLGKIESDKVVKIEVPTSGLSLEKKGETWETVQKFPVRLDQEEIKSITWSLSNMRADRVIEEEPKNLSLYGLDNPKSRVIVTTSDGTVLEYVAGNMSPSRSGYYAMQKGDPKVYLVPSYPGERLYLKMSDIRDKKLPTFDPKEVQHVILLSGKTRIEIESRNEKDHLVSSFSSHVVTSPYKTVRGADLEKLNALLSALKDLRVREFVDDRPASLAPYGLDNPAADIFIQAGTSGLHLLVGKSPEGSSNRVFAKLASEPGVFTLDDIREAIRVKPFDLIDKFALIINIDKVNSFSVKAEGKTYTGEIKREITTVAEKDAEGKETTKEETKETYFYNGKPAEEKSFKDFYQACIGLVADAEHPAPTSKAAPAEIEIVYHLNDPAGKTAEIRFVPYNRDFYALYRDGVSDFLVSRMQVGKILEAAEKVTAPR